jgi:hypothetical protein
VFSVKVAVTDLAASIDKMQLPRPVHAPDQPVNNEPIDARGVSAIPVPKSKASLQVAGQEIPPGNLTTEPDPVPARATES